MTLRGLISPPRSRSSPRGGRLGNPQPKPNYSSPSPFRRPTAGNPNEQRTLKKDSLLATNVKAPALRTTKNNSAALSPPRTRSSPKPTRPAINAPAANPRTDASKPTTTIVPSRRLAAASNPNDLQGQKKLDDQSSSKMASKTGYGANGTRPSSPRLTTTRNAVQDSAQQRVRRNNGVEPPPTTAVKPSQPRVATLSKSTVKGAIASGSKFDSTPGPNIAAAKDNNANLISQKYFDSRNNSPKHLPGHGGQQVANISSPGNQNRYSGGHHSSMGDPEVNNQLQQLATEHFTPKKIHQSIGCTEVHNDGPLQSPEKRLAGSPSQSPLQVKDLGNSTDEPGSEMEESSSQTHAPRIFQIYKDIASHHQGTLSITSYFTKMKTLWDELASYSDLPVCSCGAMAKLSEHGERERVMQFLAGLHDFYSTICSQILLMKPFPTMEKAYSVILREEKRRELLVSLEIVAEKLKQNSWSQNDQFDSHANDYSLLRKAISDGNGNFFHSTLFNGDDPDEVDQNASDTMPASICNPDVEVPSFPHEPLLIDLGSPLRC